MEQKENFVHAMRGHDVVTVEKLLQSGMDPNTNVGREFALIYAVETDDIVLVRLLLDYHADVNEISRNGCSALVLAVSNGNIDMMRLLLEKKANPNTVSDRTKYTPLMAAVNKGRIDMAHLLIENGARETIDTISYDFAGITLGSALLIAVHRACVYQRGAELVHFLLENGANPDIGSDNGTTPLIVATKGCRFDLIALICEYGADVDLQNNNGYTALMIASLSCPDEIVDFLLTKGADPNKTLDDGTTALIMASYKKRESIVKMLLEHGADIGAKNDEGETFSSFSFGRKERGKKERKGKERNKEEKKGKKEEKKITIYVKTLGGDLLQIDLSTQDTVKMVKHKIVDIIDDMDDIDANKIKLFNSETGDELLRDNSSLSEYEIENDHTLFMMVDDREPPFKDKKWIYTTGKKIESVNNDRYRSSTFHQKFLNIAYQQPQNFQGSLEDFIEEFQFAMPLHKRNLLYFIERIPGMKYVYANSENGLFMITNRDGSIIYEQKREQALIYVRGYFIEVSLLRALYDDELQRLLDPSDDFLETMIPQGDEFFQFLQRKKKEIKEKKGMDKQMEKDRKQKEKERRQKEKERKASKDSKQERKSSKRERKSSRRERKSTRRERKKSSRRERKSSSKRERKSSSRRERKSSSRRERKSKK